MVYPLLKRELCIYSSGTALIIAVLYCFFISFQYCGSSAYCGSTSGSSSVSSIVSVSDAFDVSDVAFVSEAFSVDTTEALSVSTTVSVSVSAASSVLSATSTTTACCPLRLSAVPASAKADNVDGIINAMTHIADINFFIFLYSFVVSISVIIISYSSLPVAPSKCNLFSQIYGYFS